MSYCEENGKVILTMERDEFDRLLMVFALATLQARIHFPAAEQNVFRLLNSLNAGNPKYRPYEVD